MVRTHQRATAEYVAWATQRPTSRTWVTLLSLKARGLLQVRAGMWRAPATVHTDALVSDYRTLASGLDLPEERRDAVRVWTAHVGLPWPPVHP